MITALVKGFIVGLGASIPLGPLGVLCVQKTLGNGRNSGFITGLGASVSDTFYAAISLMGLAFIQNLIDENMDWVMFIGGLIIMYIGVKIYLTNPIKQIKQKNKNKKHVEDFFEALFMTITNPGAIFLILGLFAAVGINVGESVSKSTLIATLWGVFAGSAAWWFALSTTINVFRKRFRIKQLMMINKISGIVIFVLGLISMFNGVFELVLKATK
ncbi:MAG: LysE family transporter [Bacteroidales bacterium]|jgi:threonine/homoserine/homoserine lactone efflux protein|nr:LysE family transporter [Bacteroidales bacterium]